MYKNIKFQSAMSHMHLFLPNRANEALANKQTKETNKMFCGGRNTLQGILEENRKKSSSPRKKLVSIMPFPPLVLE